MYLPATRFMKTNDRSMELHACKYFLQKWNCVSYTVTFQRPLVAGNELLYFADICAGPGGFSEYVLWRRKGECKGFGLTLRQQNDFKLEDFFAGPSEMFEPHYGESVLDLVGRNWSENNTVAAVTSGGLRAAAHMFHTPHSNNKVTRFCRIFA